MTVELVALKVTIEYRPDMGKPMKYPDFDTIVKAENRGNMNWCHYVDMYHGGHLDKKSKMKEADTVNPDPSKQYMLLTVPEAFALDAVAGDPEHCEIITPTDAGTFYNNRAHADDPEEIIDESRLNQIKVKHGVTGDIVAANKADWTDDEINAVDKEHPAPGIVRNRTKKMSDFLTEKGIVLKTVK